MKKIPVWLPLGVITLVLVLDMYLGYYCVKVLSLADYGRYLSYLRISNLPIFCFSYFLTPFVVKNKQYGLGFLFIYLIAIVAPFFIGKTAIVYSILSMFNAIKFSCSAILLYLGFDWFNKQKLARELEKQNLQSELSLLKNQINPHLLFNTLNNIDSLIKKNPSYASESIIELSDMMRYMIYETNVNKVPLQKELDYIDNYLNLQKLQYFNNDLVEYTITGDPEDKEVAPMLFIPFVENAFKHCTNKETKHAIKFSFLLESDKICFEAINIYDKTQTISKDKSGGIGLDTVKRRLEILYPNQHSLQIQEKNDLFCILLMIKIND